MQARYYLQEKKSCTISDGYGYMYHDTHGPRVCIIPDIKNPFADDEGSTIKERLCIAIVSGLVSTIVSDPDVIAKLHHDRVRQSHVCDNDIVCHSLFMSDIHETVCALSVIHVRYG